MSSVSRFGNRRSALRGFAAVCASVAFVAVGGAAAADPPPSPTAEPVVQGRDGQAVEPPEMKNWTWLVADAESGDVLAGRDWHWPLPPASTLKTLTALSLVNRLDMNSVYRAQASETDAEGSKVGLKAGSTYTVRDLFNGMLMPSGNDAAEAVANAYGGVGRATEAMNAEVQRLGAHETVVKNTSGLDEEGQTSSAYDLAMIMRESLKNDTLREIYSQHDVQFPGEEPKDAGQERKQYTIWTENRLILNYYQGALAGKTGFTSQAGRTFVGAAERDGRTLIVAIMRSAESTERAVHRALDWAFENADKLQPVDHLNDPAPEPDLVPQQAVTYDENGTNNLAAVATDSDIPTESGGGGVNPLLLLTGAAGVGGAILIMRRRAQVAAASAKRRQQAVDLRERDRTPLP